MFKELTICGTGTPSEYMMLGKWCRRRIQCMVTINFQFVMKHSICDAWLHAVQCLKSMPVNQLKQVMKRDWLAFEKDGAAFVCGSTPHSAPCLLCYFPHLRSSLGHETVRFALGTLLKSLLGCGVPQESFNPRESQIWAPISGDWRDNHHKIQVIQRPAQTFSQV